MMDILSEIVGTGEFSYGGNVQIIQPYM